jgi:hypothetical protein
LTFNIDHSEVNHMSIIHGERLIVALALSSKISLL